MYSDYHFDCPFFQDPREFSGVRVFQIGRMYCKQTTVVATHIQRDWYELTVVTDGAGIVFTNDVPQRVERGDIYLSLPDDAHRIESDREKPLKYDFFAFQTEIPTLKNEFERIAVDYRSPYHRVFREERVSAQLANALSEIYKEDSLSKELLSALLREILIYTVRKFHSPTDKPLPASVTRAEQICYQAMHYIDTHIYSLKSLAEVARQLGYSYGYLSSLFQKTTSTTLRDYLLEKRLENARYLLLENRVKISDIAELLGYASVYSFSKAFHARFGLSPRLYQQQNAKPTAPCTLPTPAQTL